jgi:hypothetical protein
MNSRTKLAISVVGVFIAFAGVGLLPIGSEPLAGANPREEVKGMDLSQYSAEPPKERLNLVFLHHSVGSQLLASPEEDREHGGGLRALLESSNYDVHEATYGSKLGENTDLFHWLPKFRDQMPAVLAIDAQDKTLPAGTTNRVVLFKSCFPNNEFSGEGDGAGNPSGPELTLANARATLTALRAEFEKHPDVLFVYLTAPPLASKPWSDRLWRAATKKVLGKPSNAEIRERSSVLSRRFNDWVVDSNGWLAGYAKNNVAVFDLFGVLSDGGSLLKYPARDARDAHPGRAGSEKAARALVPVLNRAVRRAGLSE